MSFKLAERLIQEDRQIVYSILVRYLSFKNQKEYFSSVDNEKSFTGILFYGEESSLFIWNTVTFLFIDFLATDYVLAAAITYILNSVSIIF